MPFWKVAPLIVRTEDIPAISGIYQVNILHWGKSEFLIFLQFECLFQSNLVEQILMLPYRALKHQMREYSQGQVNNSLDSINLSLCVSVNWTKMAGTSCYFLWEPLMNNLPTFSNSHVREWPVHKKASRYGDSGMEDYDWRYSFSKSGGNQT